MTRITLAVAARLHEAQKQLDAQLDAGAPPGLLDLRAMVTFLREQRDVLTRADAADTTVIAFPPRPGIRVRAVSETGPRGAA